MQRAQFSSVGAKREPSSGMNSTRESCNKRFRSTNPNLHVLNEHNSFGEGYITKSGSRKLKEISSTKRQGIGILRSKENGSNGLKVIEVNDTDGSTNYSRAIAIRRRCGSREERQTNRKSSDDKPCRLKRRRKRKSVKEDEDKLFLCDDGRHCNGALQLPEDSSLDAVEGRKRSIRAKLSTKKEQLLTQEEEQDIHARAEMYAITASPDCQFFTLPEHDTEPRLPFTTEETLSENLYPSMRKRRRRNYGSSCCYITMHKYDDFYDNTKMLPIGTRLSKPTTKLVELVAMAIDGSPDGLLQVQQIYTFLQNRYPYFRYMERAVINSWRSSIRHALYQKWFRKIRFDVASINCKGCYWAINHKSNPKEWTMPLMSSNLDTGEEDEMLLENLEVIKQDMADSVCALLQQEQDEDTHKIEDVVAIAREYGISATLFNQHSEEEKEEDEKSQRNKHVPSPVREPDPILAVCAPDWQAGQGNDEISLTTMTTNESDSSIHGNSSGISSSNCSSSCDVMDSSLYASLYFSVTDGPETLQLGTPICSPGQVSRLIVPPSTPVAQKSFSTYQEDTDKTKSCEVARLSPLDNWTPNWEEYDTYLLSPLASEPSMYPALEQDTESVCDIEHHGQCLSTRGCLTSHQQQNSLHSLEAVVLENQFVDSVEDFNKNSTTVSSFNSDSDYIEYEILAEFPKQNDPSSPSSTSSLGSENCDEGFAT